MKNIVFVITIILALLVTSIGFIACSDSKNDLNELKVNIKSSIVLPDGNYTFYNTILTFKDGEVTSFKDGKTGELLDPPISFAHKSFPKTKQGEADAMALLDKQKDWPCVSMGIIKDEKGKEYWLVTWSNPPCLVGCGN